MISVGVRPSPSSNFFISEKTDIFLTISVICDINVLGTTLLGGPGVTVDPHCELVYSRPAEAFTKAQTVFYYKVIKCCST